MQFSALEVIQNEGRRMGEYCGRHRCQGNDMAPVKNPMAWKPMIANSNADKEVRGEESEPSALV
jgi:hypothetical protein